MNHQLLKALDQAKKVFQVESQAILDLQGRLDENFQKALTTIVECRGKVIFTGIGKSGHMARKIASTMSSTGTPAFFLHPAESSHGDLGVIASQDVVVAISYGSGSRELEDVIKYTTRKGIPLIAITSNRDSLLAQSAQAILDVKIKEEACPLNLAPTASSAATLAMGDALAMAALVYKGFKEEEFAEYHPGGSLGFRLLTRIKDIMHSGAAVPLVQLETPIHDVLKVMTHRDVRGMAIVVDAKGELSGVITDGDLRRCLEKDMNIKSALAKDIMGKTPKSVDSEELAEKAIHLMESFRIQTLVVLNRNAVNPRVPVGVVHLQDLLKAKVK